MSRGLVRVHQIDPAELAPDEFTHLVRREVADHGARIIVVDSINGYYQAMPEARHLSLQLHELLGFLAERGVASLITMTQSGLVGTHMTTPVDVSYLADTIIMLRYFEMAGRVRKAISVVKKRSGPHEDTIRPLDLGPGGLAIGPPLEWARGVLSGVPQLVGHGIPHGSG